jgi:retron-type reverse transcriptase
MDGSINRQDIKIERVEKVVRKSVDHSTLSAGKLHTWGRVRGINNRRGEMSMGSSETQELTATKLKRITWLSGKDSAKEFNSLMHYFNIESLKECYHQLNGKKAVGIDGVNKEQYGVELDKNIENLIARMKTMSYRPGPIKQVLILKEGKVGATRPLGISNTEDKIVQKMTQKILNSIYDPIFLKSSYGFRQGTGNGHWHCSSYTYNIC